MPRGTQIGRWWTIVQELQASRLGLPADTLAQRHGWNPRTVYRDLRGRGYDSGLVRAEHDSGQSNLFHISRMRVSGTGATPSLFEPIVNL